jgi:hypothetical protein
VAGPACGEPVAVSVLTALSAGAHNPAGSAVERIAIEVGASPLAADSDCAVFREAIAPWLRGVAVQLRARATRALHAHTDGTRTTTHRAARGRRRQARPVHALAGRAHDPTRTAILRVGGHVDALATATGSGTRCKEVGAIGACLPFRAAGAIRDPASRFEAKGCRGAELARIADGAAVRQCAETFTAAQTLGADGAAGSTVRVGEAVGADAAAARAHSPAAIEET